MKRKSGSKRMQTPYSRSGEINSRVWIDVINPTSGSSLIRMEACKMCVKKLKLKPRKKELAEQ